MINVSICDRCGKIIKSITDVYSVTVVDRRNTTRTFKEDTESTTLDICQDCYNELKDFIISNQRIK